MYMCFNTICCACLLKRLSRLACDLFPFDKVINQTVCYNNLQAICSSMSDILTACEERSHGCAKRLSWRILNDIAAVSWLADMRASP